MTASINDVLDELRESALDERDKGDKFERLVQAYLKTDLEWANRFTDVWLWSDWPGREGRPDTGIDLVAANRDAEDFTAIQCKFYAPGHKVAKADIDSFISAAARKEFTDRIVFDTAAGWSGNAEETLYGVAHRVDISYLTDAAIDWDQYSWATPSVVVPTGKNTLRPHQQQALDDVRAGLTDFDRGKLIMACGTGKTFTSLKIAEDLVGAHGSVLFLVPSIQLMSQSLREWTANAEVDLRPFAVCSDVRVGRKQLQADEGDMATVDLAEPATTDAATLLARMKIGRHAVAPRMTVVFSTYQSIDVIIEAQRQGLADFDLVICDEAHRTTGVTLKNTDESAFVKIHDNSKLKAAKRLYMTATPRVFDDNVKRKATDADAVLADMGDEATFGPELHRLGFGEAVEAGLLTDYKVLVLAVDESYVAENFQQAMSESGEMKLDDAAKLIGCWNGLAKNFGPDRTDGETVNPAPMRTAVAFAQTINASKLATAAFPTIVDRALLDQPDDRAQLRVEARHVDGTMGIHDRNAHLAWLKDTAPGDACRILTNARCLSEGVDVPALDAVLFLTPRGSQVDVVQSVGRVMRLSPGKELGYIILPVVVPAGVTPEDALRDNERYRVVWQVLQALRSHDDRFHAMVNQIELNKKKPSRLEVITVTNRTDADTDGSSKPSKETGDAEPVQRFLEFPSDQFRDAMYARIVAKVGERRYWETWAKDVSDIAAAHITRVNGLLADPTSPAAIEFARFLDGLRGNLNDNITAAEAVEMLAQHLVTRPIFEALFEDYNFGEHNPVAQTMERMLAVLDEHSLEAENETLRSFYDSVRRRVAGVDNAEGKQRILVELYDKFFATAFKKTVDKLGIVYTPVEIVDFILRSADQVLRAEFGQGLTDEGVHILDGFTGTGTFLVRLMQSGLIEPHDLARKYAAELHGNEILLLAYYIAAVNIETTYQDLTRTTEPFPGLILTDTFQSWEPDDKPDLDVFPENNLRLEKLKALPITAVIGNPPYSAKQGSANDNNANEKYPAVDEEIRRTYTERSAATNKNAMYDSYRRAIKWASLRLKDRGVVAFVTNGGFIEEKSSDGMRKALVDEFSSIYVLNLRGNQKSADWKREGGKVFGGGSQATVAVLVLVKDSSKAGAGTLRYAEIGDFLSREEKLDKVARTSSIHSFEGRVIVPDEHGDWLNQRSSDFVDFLGMDVLFGSYSGGVKTNRDAWCYNFGEADVAAAMQRLIATYEAERAAGRTSAETTTDTTLISWNLSLQKDLDRGRPRRFDESSVRIASYRPFNRQHLYFSRELNDAVYRQEHFFPTSRTVNEGFYTTSSATSKPFSTLMLSALPDVNHWGSEAGQFFPRYRYEQVSDSGMLDLAGEGAVVDGYRQIDNITGQALKQFGATHPGESITKDDIFFYLYGLLHSPAYRKTYAADLKKVLPRIPLVEGFRGFADAGRKLSDLHLGYETVAPHPLAGLDATPPAGVDAYDFYRVQKMRFPKKGERGSIVYNDRVTVSGIPEDAYRYMLGSRSAIEWIIDRYQVKTDKPSGIVNDPNDWSREVGDPRYILDLLARIVTVSIETMKIVDALPPLAVIDQAAEARQRGTQ